MIHRWARRRWWVPIVVLGFMTAAVIWAKLRLVGDVPRTAYAEPADLKPHTPARLDD